MRQICSTFAVAASGLILLAGCGGGGASAPAAAAASTDSSSLSRTGSFARVQSSSALAFEYAPIVARRNSPSSVTPDLTPGFANADAASTAAIVVADSATDDVYAYTTHGALIAKISHFNGPEGMTLDSSGNLYVANINANDVLVYKNDYKTLLATLNDANELPADVSVEPTTGLVGVTNLYAASGSTGGVSFYAKGATTPCKTVVFDPSWFFVYDGAFDAAGNFYVTGQTSSGASLIGVVKGGCSATAVTALTTTNVIGLVYGILVSPAGKILVTDARYGKIFSYNPPVKNSLGSVVGRTLLVGAHDPGDMALTADGTMAFTANGRSPWVTEFAYPAGGNAVETYVNPNLPSGIVVTPSAVP